MGNFCKLQTRQSSVTCFLNHLTIEIQRLQVPTGWEESWSGIGQEKWAETHEGSVSGHKKARETHLPGERLWKEGVLWSPSAGGAENPELIRMHSPWGKTEKSHLCFPSAFQASQEFAFTWMKGVYVLLAHRAHNPNIARFVAPKLILQHCRNNVTELDVS